jgi:hypothetical protein
MPMPSKRIQVRGLKVTTLANPAELIGLVPDEPAPAGDVVLDLAVTDTPLVVRARISGKGVRRGLKVIAEHGTENVNALLQGNLRAAAAAGEPYSLDAAGLSVTPRAPKPVGPQEGG